VRSPTPLRGHRVGLEHLLEPYRGVVGKLLEGLPPAPVVEEASSRRELVEGLIEAVASFAEKLYGTKSSKKEKLVEGFKKLLEEVEKSE